MISPLSLMSARFKLRVICRILFLIFTTRLITVPGRMSAVSTLIPARLSFSFHIELLSHARNFSTILIASSISSIPFLCVAFPSISEQVSDFIFSRNRKGTRSFSLLSVITRTTRKHEEKRRDLDEIWKMEEIIVEKEHSNCFSRVSNCTMYFEKCETRKFCDENETFIVSVFFCSHIVATY